MEVAELQGLYRKAKVVRDESVRQNILQSIAQLAASTDALNQARDNPGFGAEAIKSDAGAALLVEQAEAQLATAGDAAAKLIGSRGKAIVAARGAQALAGEAIAAEAIAAEALAAEAVAVETAEGMFSGEPFAVESAMLEGTMAEGVEAVGASLRTFVSENAQAG